MNEQCIKCAKKAKKVLKHLSTLCNFCFVKVLEKRIRRDLSKNKTFQPHNNVIIIDDNSLQAQASLFFLKNISKNIPLNIKTRKSIPKTIPKNTKIVIPKNLDNEIESFLKNIFKKQKPKKTKFIKLLKSISNEELELLAKIKKFKKPIKKTKLTNILSKLEQRYPGSKFGLLKTTKELS